MTRPTILANIVALAAALLLLGGCGKMPAEPLPQIAVWLGGSPGKVTGMPPWPRGSLKSTDPDSFADLSGVDIPCVLTVHFPSGRKWTSWTSATCFFQDDGVVNHVALWPPNQQLPYHEAVDEVERLMKEFGIRERPGVDPPFKDWRQNQPREDLPTTRATAGFLEKGVLVRLEIRCDEEHKCWFVGVEFDLVGN